MEERYRILAIYDITNNKRRSRLVKCLESFGRRVQKSAFEASLSRQQYEQMTAEARRYINPQEDSLRFYFLSKTASVKSYGKKFVSENKTIII